MVSSSRRNTEVFSRIVYKNMQRTLAFVAMLLLTVTMVAPAPVQAQSAEKAKLVLVVVADQFSYNFISRFSDKFGTNGLRLLSEKGASFTHCRYENASTQTAIGHSVIATGAYPWSTGIVGDEWLDRRKGKSISAVNDDNVQLVGAPGTGSSTRLLQGTTIGDQMKLASNGRSKVIGLSLKDRASLLLSGRLANTAYWWDTKTGNFVTSAQYCSQLPVWAQQFNDQHYADKFQGKPWQRAMADTAYNAATRDDFPYERPFDGGAKQFPHMMAGTGEPFYSKFAMTPMANQMLGDFAKQVIEKESLGAHTDTDYLGISFSAGEGLGQNFGPYSQEVEDLTVRLDQTIADLFRYIDGKVGLNNCLVVFTSDHGVAPIPEFSKERGMEGGRIDLKAFKTAVDTALDQRLGSEDWVEGFYPPNLYLNLNAIDKQKYRQPDVEALAAKICHSISGVGEVYSAVQFFTNQMPNGPLTDAIRKSYYWGRSGELIVTPKSGFVFSNDALGTDHGSPFSYDTQVPLIMMGKQVVAGKYGTDVSPADIAPTIASVLDIEAPALSEGRVLSEALHRNVMPLSATTSAPAAMPAVEPVQTSNKKRK